MRDVKSQSAIMPNIRTLKMAMDLQAMDLQETANCLAIYLIANIPTMIHGSPGIGKSDIVRAVSRALNYDYLIDKRASTMDPVDINGVPSVVNGRTYWNPPSWLPSVETHSGKNGMIFWDEINAAHLSTQVALYQWILDRCTGDIVAPEGLRNVAAGNLQSDRGGATRMSSALANRFAHLYAVPTVEGFCNYASRGTEIEIRQDCLSFIPGNGIAPEIVAFHRFSDGQTDGHGRKINFLHNMESPDLLAFPTPRSWSQVSKILSAPRDLLLPLTSGLIGNKASQFIGFLSVYKSLPKIPSIFADPHNTPVPNEPSAKYALACAIGRAMTAGNIGAGIIYLERMSVEFSTMGIIDAVKRDITLKETTGFVQWAIRNQSVSL